MAYVLDTSAALAVLLGEPKGRWVVDLLDRARERRDTMLLPFMTVMEARYTLQRAYGPEDAAGAVRLVLAWPAPVIESTREWGVEAARVQARGGLSLGDAWIASLAILYDAQLVHSDPEFEGVEGLRTHPLG